MAIIKCSVCNKYYDDIKNAFCPHCSASQQFNNSFDANRDSVTIPLDLYDYGSSSAAEQNDQKTEAYFDYVDDNEKTIGLFFQENDYNPVTAWIVCIEGTVKGKSYEIHLNKNYLGRDKLMDICIPDDLKVSRENHLSITYDDKNNRFFVKPENGSVAVNGALVTGPLEIFGNDEIEFGESKYVFIPYCNKERNWNNEE